MARQIAVYDMMMTYQQIADILMIKYNTVATTIKTYFEDNPEEYFRRHGYPTCESIKQRIAAMEKKKMEDKKELAEMPEPMKKHYEEMHPEIVEREKEIEAAVEEVPEIVPEVVEPVAVEPEPVAVKEEKKCATWQQQLHTLNELIRLAEYAENTMNDLACGFFGDLVENLNEFRYDKFSQHVKVDWDKLAKEGIA